ncbi:hypothetical protein ACQJBY_032465 [Aegilops geniculata]
MELGSLNKILICFSNFLPLCMNLSSRSFIWCMYAAVDLLVLICCKRKCDIVLINFFHSMCNVLQHQFHWFHKVHVCDHSCLSYLFMCVCFFAARLTWIISFLSH